MKLVDYILQKYDGNISAAARDLGKHREKVRKWCHDTIPRESELVDQQDECS